jgi:hypothetical protein
VCDGQLPGLLELSRVRFPGSRSWLVGSLAGVLALAACREKPVTYPASSGPTAPADTATTASTATTATEPEAPPPPAITFQRGAEIRFKNGPPLKLTTLTKQSRVLAVSPDGRGYTATPDGQIGRIISDAKPEGWPFDAHPSTLATYAPDGAHVAVWGFGVQVFETRTGRQVADLAGQPCDLRFVSPSEIVFHTSSLGETDNQLVRYRLGGGPALLGPKRDNRYCSGSADGSMFIVHDPAPVRAVDGITGRERVLWRDARWDTAVSPNGDRVCVWAPNTLPSSDLICIRAGDRGQEVVIPKKSTPMYANVIFDPTGARAWVTHSIEEPHSADGIRIESLLVDFASRTVRPVIGHQPKSGSIPALMTGGELLVQGSSSGVMAYDLERGVKRFAAKTSLYGTMPIPHHRRRFITDREIGSAWAESYYVDVP